MADLCSRSEYCISDIRKKILKDGLTGEDAEKIITALCKEKFIDENRYARMYVRDKFTFNKWGKQKIAYMLKMKQVDQEYIREALENIEEPAYEDSIRNVLTDKSKHIKGKDLFDKQAKLIRFGLGKGFEPNLVYRIVKEIEL